MEQLGWIQLYRKFIDWEWYTDTNTKSVFIHCLLKANHKEANWRGQLIKRGQLITSYSTLSSETGLSVQNIRTSIKNLESTGDLTRQSTSKLTKLTICNYDTYNNLKDLANKPTNKPSTNDQQAPNNKQECKEQKEEEKEAIDYLNLKTGKKFRTAKGLKARFNDGYTIDDVKKVIDIKVSEWIDNDDMKRYLTPDTLFSGKFDKYLNQEVEAAQSSKEFDPTTWKL